MTITLDKGKLNQLLTDHLCRIVYETECIGVDPKPSPRGHIDRYNLDSHFRRRVQRHTANLQMSLENNLKELLKEASCEK